MGDAFCAKRIEEGEEAPSDVAVLVMSYERNASTAFQFPSLKVGHARVRNLDRNRLPLLNRLILCELLL